MHILFKFSEISFVWHLLKNTRQIMITGIIIAYILSYFIKFILSAHDITNIIMIIAIIGPIRSLIFLDVSSGIVNSFFNNRFIISDVNSMMYSIMLVKKRSTKKVRNVFLMFFSSDVFLLNMVYTRLYDQGFFMSYISMCEFIT